MFIENIFIDGFKTNYNPYNLTETINKLIVQGEADDLASSDFLKLGENDPILQFFPISKFQIGFDLSHHKGFRMIVILAMNLLVMKKVLSYIFII